MSAVTDMLDTIDAKIAALIAADSITSYKIGDKQVDRAGALKVLGELREKYQALAEKEPYEDISSVAMGYDDLGDDISELVGGEEEA